MYKSKQLVTVSIQNKTGKTKRQLYLAPLSCPNDEEFINSVRLPELTSFYFLLSITNCLIQHEHNQNYTCSSPYIDLHCKISTATL